MVPVPVVVVVWVGVVAPLGVLAVGWWPCGWGSGGAGLGWPSVWPPTSTLDLSVNPVFALLGLHLICSSYKQFRPSSHRDNISNVAYQSLPICNSV